MEAALKGSAEIGFTIVSLTVSLIAVLIPLLFMADIVGTAVPRIRGHTCRNHRIFGICLTNIDPDDGGSNSETSSRIRAGTTIPLVGMVLCQNHRSVRKNGPGLFCVINR